MPEIFGILKFIANILLIILIKTFRIIVNQRACNTRMVRNAVIAQIHFTQFFHDFLTNF